MQFTSVFSDLIALALCGQACAADKPNVVYLLADDLGWGDPGANGGSIPTPRIDRLLQEGVRCDNFMGWCVCSPTRAMLLTGRQGLGPGEDPGFGTVYQRLRPRHTAGSGEVKATLATR